MRESVREEFARVWAELEDIRAKAGYTPVTTTGGSISVVALSATLAAQQITNATPVTRGGTNYSAIVTLGSTLFAAGESAVLQLKKNGIAVGGTIPLNSTLPKGTINASLTYAGVVYVPGDILTLDITYTAGGAPNHPTFSLSLGWA